MNPSRSDSLGRIAPRAGVYFRVVDGEGVVMDIVANRYYGLTGDAAEIWQRVVSASASPAGERLTDCPLVDSETMVSEAVEAWRASNLIESTANRCAEEQLPVAKDAREPAKVGIPGKDIRAAPRSLVIFGALVRETLRTKRLVRRRGLAVALACVQRITVSGDVSSRRDDLLSILHTYYVSRLPLSQGKGDCLPRSLALTSLLRRRGIDAEICFGIEKFPFRAHAWVEAGGLVINDTPNGIRRYTVLARF
jgi:hypothetical protein